MGLYKCCPVSSFIKAAGTHYRRLDGLQTTRIYFPLFWSLEDQGQGAGRAGAWQSLLPGAHCSAACVPPGEEGVRDLPEASFLRTPSHSRALPTWPDHLRKAPPPNTTTLAVRPLNIWILKKQEHSAYERLLTLQVNSVFLFFNKFTFKKSINTHFYFPQTLKNEINYMFLSLSV